MGSNLIPKQRYKCWAAADLRDTGTTDSGYPASDKSYPYNSAPAPKATP